MNMAGRGDTFRLLPHCVLGPILYISLQPHVSSGGFWTECVPAANSGVQEVV